MAKYDIDPFYDFPSDSDEINTSSNEDEEKD